MRRVALGAVVVLGLAGFWATARACHGFLDAPYVMPPIDAPNALGSARVVTPVEVLLEAFAIAWLVPAIAALTVLCKGVPLFARFERASLTRAIAALVAVCAALFVARALVGVAILDDERSYLFQADLFAKGKIALPAIPAALRNPMIITSPVHTSRYPPGNGLLLALGVLLHAPTIGHALLAGVLVLAVSSAAGDAFGRRHAKLTAVLVAVCPFVWAAGGTTLPFIVAATASALVTAGIARHARTKSFASAAFAGAALATLGLTRPFDALIVGIACSVWLSLHARALRSFGGFAIGVASLVWILFWHNHAITGSMLVPPYFLDHEAPFFLGFTRSFGTSYVHTPVQAAVIEATLWMRLDGWLLGFPGALVLVVIGALRACGAPLTSFVRLAITSYLVLFLLLPSPGTWDVGPTYGGVIMPVLWIAAARGAHRLWLARRDLTEWALAATIIAGLTAVTPLRLLRLTRLAREIQVPWDFIAKSGYDGVIVVPSNEFRRPAGWGFGYPYVIPTGDRTRARLCMPFKRAEYDEVMRWFGADRSVVLTLDRARFDETGERRYSLVPFDARAFTE